MRKNVRKSILSIKPYVPGKPIDEVKRELGLRKVIKLASNENPFCPSPKVLKAIEQSARQVNRYPDGGCFLLRKLLSSRLKVNNDELIFGNGSDELIVLSVRAFVQPGDEVIIAKPSFLIYQIASAIEGAVIKSVPLINFRYDLEGMKKAVSKKTKIIFLGNPDNPAGSYFTKKMLEDFIAFVPKDVLIFIDEAYFEYVTEKDYVDSLALVKKYKNIIVTRTFSKMYGLAGLRIGYGIANKEIIDLLNRIREPFNVNSLAQAAAIACLNDQPYYKRVADVVRFQRQYLMSSLERLGLVFIKSYTNFILVKLTMDSKIIVKKLMERGVIVRDMSSWQMKNFIRITIGTPSENKLLINALEEVL